MANPKGREIHAGILSVRAKAAPMESGTATTMAMNDDCRVPRMMGQAPNCDPGGVGDAVGVDGGAVAVAVRPVLAVEEVKAVDADGRPRLDREHGDGEDERHQGEHDRHPGAPTPALFLVGPEHVRHPAEQRVPRCGASGWRGGSFPRHATDGRHYEMLRICFTDCASTLEGSGWKLTWARYVVAAPSFGLTAHSSSERIPFAVVLLDWWVETMAYS